ncbi:unnamed protein product [Lactuca virosa]|uniref:NAC domain-containing protein n=1 Tax=Lactuca virosa TaxID=75947 RepID=A0AAU9NJP1_9ASTR|nr:unnamed protein product [Lactuca virosa]
MAVVLDSVTPAPTTASSLAPGFRFHPTDEELVRYYLRRKICGKPFRFDAISDVDVYKVEPWDLPGLSRLKSRDLEWYFFSVLDKKYGNGSRTNRATDKGGRAPKGERTNWVMHEYRLIDQELEKAGIVQDSFVLCRIFRKSGSGPKNGEQYGAPFVEEEWEDDELVMVPKQEFAEDFPVDDDDAYLDANDLEQILGSDTPDKVAPLPLDLHDGDNLSSADVSTEMIEDPQKLLMDEGEDQHQADKEDVPKLFDLPVQNGMDPKSVKHEYIGETNNASDFDVDYLLDEPFFDASTGDFQFDASSFLEADDLKNEVKTEPGLEMFDEYTSFINPTNNLEYTFDSIDNEDILPESSLILENANEDTHEAIEATQQFFEGQNCNIAPTKVEQPDLATGNNGASSSGQEHQDSAPHEANEASQQPFEEFAYPFLQRASYMLGNISAPPAFASEYPSKYLAAAASQASTSVRVTTGMIRIRDVSFTGTKLDWSLGKNGHLDIVLSLRLDQDRSVVGKGHSRSWFFCLFLCIMVVSLSSQISSLICPRSYMS